MKAEHLLWAMVRVSLVISLSACNQGNSAGSGTPTPTPVVTSEPTSGPSQTPGPSSTPAPSPSGTPMPTAVPMPEQSPLCVLIGALPLPPILPICEPASPTPDPTSAPGPTATPSPGATPTASPTASPNPPSNIAGEARACFNAYITTVGIRVIERIRTVASRGETDVQRETVVMGADLFNDQDVWMREQHSTTLRNTNPDVVPSEGRTKTYYRADDSAFREEIFGYYGEFIRPAADPVTVEFEPPLLQRFDLDRGQSHTQINKATFRLSNGAILESVDRRTSTYVGGETVTVPAGTFPTCRFDYTNTEQEENGETDRGSVWYHVGSGILIRAYSEGDGEDPETTELLSATMDGAPIQ